MLKFHRRHFREPLDLISVQYIIPSPYLLILPQKKVMVSWTFHLEESAQKPKCIA